MRSREDLEQLFCQKMGWEKLQSNQSKNIFELLYFAGQNCHPDSVVLDISAGQCRYKPFFDHANYVAIDSTVGDKSWNFNCLNIVGDAFHLPIKSSSIDVCLNFTSLEHYQTPQQAFNEVSRTLKSGGKFFLYVPCVIGEHQIPHDFFRYTRYALAHLTTTSGMEIGFIKPTNSIFETSLGLLKTAIAHLPKCPEQDKAIDAFVNVIYPIFTAAEKLVPAKSDYPDVNSYPQLPEAYCLFAKKP